MKLRLIDRACALGVFTAAVFAAPTAPAQSCNDGYHPDVDNWVSAMALQADGKVVIGGAFTNVGGVTRRFIARLNADGSLDLGFNPGAGSHVLALTVQPDGKILVGGLFYTLGGRQKHCLGRLNPDGSVDTSFSAVVVEGSGVYSLLIQSDGKTVVGGLFRTLSTSLGEQVRTNLARLNGDGTIDSFNPGAGHYHSESVGGVFCLAQQPDGQLLVGGIIRRWLVNRAAVSAD